MGVSSESVKEYMQRREREAREEELRKWYHRIEHTREAEELQRANEEIFNKFAKWWRRNCGLDA